MTPWPCLLLRKRTKCLIWPNPDKTSANVIIIWLHLLPRFRYWNTAPPSAGNGQLLIWSVTYNVKQNWIRLVWIIEVHNFTFKVLDQIQKIITHFTPWNLKLRFWYQRKVHIISFYYFIKMQWTKRWIISPKVWSPHPKLKSQSSHSRLWDSVIFLVSKPLELFRYSGNASMWSRK